MNDDVNLKIVIPTYNRAGRVKNLLQKLSEASKQPFIDIVVVDDFSKEEEREQLKVFALTMPTVDFIFLPQNSGGGKARNFGAFSSPASWVWFIDDDDVVDSETVIGVFNKVSLHLKENLFFVNVNYHKSERVVTVKPKSGNVFKQFSRYGSNINTTGAIFSFELINKLRGWDSKLVAGQDTDLLLRAAEISDVYVLEDYSVDVIQHDGERITTNPKKQMIGKVQFIRKNYLRLHPMRLLRYIFTTITFYPYIRRVFDK